MDFKLLNGCIEEIEKRTKTLFGQRFGHFIALKFTLKRKEKC